MSTQTIPMALNGSFDASISLDHRDGSESPNEGLNLSMGDYSGDQDCALSTSSLTSQDFRMPDKLQRNLKPKDKEKKRVQCDECLKWYCDKGALKIHKGAVHRNEIHYCWRPGCKAFFSSRRSRNRHSKNNSEKLHSNVARSRCASGLIKRGAGEEDGEEDMDEQILDHAETQGNIEEPDRCVTGVIADTPSPSASTSSNTTNSSGRSNKRKNPHPNRVVNSEVTSEDSIATDADQPLDLSVGEPKKIRCAADNMEKRNDDQNQTTNKINRRQCVACGKIFQNQGAVRVHFETVHMNGKGSLKTGCDPIKITHNNTFLPFNPTPANQSKSPIANFGAGPGLPNGNVSLWDEFMVSRGMYPSNNVLNQKLMAQNHMNMFHNQSPIMQANFANFIPNLLIAAAAQAGMQNVHQRK